MGKSSKDKRDAYYRLAKEQGWRARSAFKLIQLDEQFDLFRGVTRVVDLCAAPGSWSQVLSRILIRGERFGRTAWEEKCQREDDIVCGNQRGETPLRPTRENVRVVAIDLQPMASLEGITTLIGDITDPSTIPRILQALDPERSSEEAAVPEEPALPEKPTEPERGASPPKGRIENHPASRQPVDLVLCDGAPDVTGLHDLDIYIQSQLLFSALNLALKVLKRGGTFVAKIFRGKDIDLIYTQLRCCFEKVSCAKPRSSRASSLEAFVVCQGFIPSSRLEASSADSSSLHISAFRKPQISSDGQAQEEASKIVEVEEMGNETRWIALFIACGDLSAWDSDATYHLPKDRVSLDPVQPPTAPPYKRALEVRRHLGSTGKPSV